MLCTTEIPHKILAEFFRNRLEAPETCPKPGVDIPSVWWDNYYDLYLKEDYEFSARITRSGDNFIWDGTFTPGRYVIAVNPGDFGWGELIRTTFCTGTGAPSSFLYEALRLGQRVLTAEDGTLIRWANALTVFEVKGA